MSACVRAPLRIDRDKPASFERAVREGVQTSNERGPLGIVLFSDAHAVGVDAETGAELWRRPIRAFGPPAVVGDTVVVPVYGHRAVALDARTGVTRWEHALPGQVLTGLAATDRGVIVTALQPDPKPKKRPKASPRSVVGAMSMNDGRIRWTRPSDALLGVPAAAGRAGFVPSGDRVLAVSLRTGRTLGTSRPSRMLDRVERHGNTLLASDGEALVDLAIGTRYDYEQDDGQLFARVDGIEPGLGHHAGTQFRLLPPKGAGAPRNGLFLGQRALIFVRLDERGRAARARWVHVRQDQHDYIDVHATADAVVLVRDDGALVRLDRATGRVQREVPGVIAPQGAAFVGDATPADDVSESVDAQTVNALLMGLVEDPDERLLAAQKLALKLLWRSAQPQTRRLVEDVAVGVARPDDGTATRALIDRATTLMQGPWGRADEAEAKALTARLESPKTRGDALRDAVREAVDAGGPSVLPVLVSLIDDPELSATELDHVARALRDLDAESTVDGAARFVTQYHADPEIVDASKAIYYLVELLISHADPDLPQYTTEAARSRAETALEAVATDEFTVPALRAFIVSHREVHPGEDAPAPDAPEDTAPDPSS